MTNPFSLPEIVGLVIDNVDMVPDLLSCACVNSIWSLIALRKLYRGSLNDMRFRTPDIASLNCLFVASRERFARNMGFVKHLLLCPEEPAPDRSEYQTDRLVCREKCRVMRHRQSTELLLRPRGKGLESLTIPFDIQDQDWPLISDLLLSPTVNFLAIDNSYCARLIASLHPSPQPRTHADKFSNLQALTIYRSTFGSNIGPICRLLDNCNLEFFHIADEPAGPSLLPDDAEQLMSSIRQQSRLKALALFTPCFVPSFLSDFEQSAGQKDGIPWPGLMELCLVRADEYWVRKIPNFEQLQILYVGGLDSEISASATPLTSEYAMKEISKCRHLRSLDIDLNALDDLDILLDVARRCPLLQQFSVRVCDPGYALFTEAMFLALLRSLPRLEIIELDLPFTVHGESLQVIASRCPQLTALCLHQSQLHLSHEAMTNSVPFPHLEIMQFLSVRFAQQPHLTQPIQSIATEWRRIFPKLRGPACGPQWCFRPRCHRAMEAKRAGESRRQQIHRENAEAGFLRPETDCFGSKFSYRSINAALWSKLDYPAGKFKSMQVRYRWLTELQIEIVGWPVVPFRAFTNPDEYSSTSKCCLPKETDDTDDDEYDYDSMSDVSEFDGDYDSLHKDPFGDYDSLYDPVVDSLRPIFDDLGSESETAPDLSSDI